MGGQEGRPEKKREGIQTCYFKPVQPVKSPEIGLDSTPAPPGELPTPASFPGDGSVCDPELLRLECNGPVS